MATSRRKATKVETNIKNVRRVLRKWMVMFAKDHRGCKTPRGCGCEVDQSLTILERAEADLFKVELASYATAYESAQASDAVPGTPRDSSD